MAVNWSKILKPTSLVAARAIGRQHEKVSDLEDDERNARRDMEKESMRTARQVGVNLLERQFDVGARKQIAENQSAIDQEDPLKQAEARKSNALAAEYEYQASPERRQAVEDLDKSKIDVERQRVTESLKQLEVKRAEIELAQETLKYKTAEQNKQLAKAANHADLQEEVLEIMNREGATRFDVQKAILRASRTGNKEALGFMETTWYESTVDAYFDEQEKASNRFYQDWPSEDPQGNLVMGPQGGRGASLETPPGGQGPVVQGGRGNVDKAASREKVRGLLPGVSGANAAEGDDPLLTGPVGGQPTPEDISAFPDSELQGYVNSPDHINPETNRPFASVMEVRNWLSKQYGGQEPVAQ